MHFSRRCRRRIRRRFCCQYRPPREVAVLKGPISSSPGRRSCLGAKARANIVPPQKRSCAILLLQAHSNHRRSQRAWRISSLQGRDTVLSGKCWGSPLSSCPGTHTVLAGKVYRPAGELKSSCGGRYIVPPGKVYRPVREKLSSSPGNLTAFFAANLRSA